MSTSTPEELTVAAAAAVWVDQAAAAVATATESASAAATAWQTFLGWYSAAEIEAIAQEMAAVSLAGQQAVAGAMAEYVAQVVALLSDTRRVQVPRISAPVIRNGVDLTKVHARPARSYRVEYAKDQDIEASIQAALERELVLIETDLMLAARDAENQAMAQLGVMQYRRVIHPELSETGTCLLCVAASMRVYKIEDLLPLHVRCKCRTMPIIGGQDPAEQFNQEDLERIYAEGGATLRQDLSNLRVKVNEHGELGPVLTVQGHKFTGPDDLKGETAPSEDDGGSDGGKPPAQAGPGGAGPPERPLLGDFITDTQQPGADHQRMVEEAWRAEMDREFGNAGLRGELDFVMFQPDNVHFDGTIYTAVGDSIGTYSRVIHRDVDGELYADHSYLKIDDSDLQGTGFADEFNEALYDWYRESGLQRVELDANIDIGGYAWASAGYGFADEFGARKSIERLENEPIGGREDGAAVRDVLDRASRFPFGHPQFPTAFEVSQAGRLPHHRGKQATWPGKRAMIGFFKNWRGVKWL